MRRTIMLLAIVALVAAMMALGSGQVFAQTGNLFDGGSSFHDHDDDDDDFGRDFRRHRNDDDFGLDFRRDRDDDDGREANWACIDAFGRAVFYVHGPLDCPEGYRAHLDFWRNRF